MGRPKQFDPEDALTAMKALFWSKGYEGTSMSDIEQATGLLKQSLYREFGSKQKMYLAALRHYEMNEARAARDILARYEGNPAEAFAALFEDVIGQAKAPGGRRGCFLCNASTDRTTLDAEIDDYVNAALTRLMGTFEDTLASAGAPKGHAGALLAGYIGLRVMVRAGFGRPVLKSTVATLLQPLNR